MTVTPELPPDVETRTTEEAAQKGMTLSDYLAAIIRERHSHVSGGLETYLLSESALAKDWLSLEEDEAWQHL